MPDEPMPRRKTPSRRIGRSRPLWDPWLLIVATTPLLGIALVTDDRAAVRAACIIGAVVLTAALIGYVTLSRLQSAAVELLIETAIGTTAVLFLGWGLGLPRPAFVGPDHVAIVLGCIAGGVALASVLCIAWLAAIDHGARRATLGFLAGAAVSLGCAGVLLAHAAAEGTAPGVPVDLAVLLAILFGAGAVTYPGRRLLQVPALDLARGHAARRAAATLGAVLVGPLLLVVPLAADTLSLPIVAAISVLLTSLAVAHVYRLLSRWGALEHDVYHDGLTGLPNRQYFNQRLQLALEHARTEDRELAVLFIDLDNFKKVNDNYGHAAGNALLTKVAARLRTELHDDITVARLGGDEFAVLVPVLASIATTGETTRRILAGFRAPFEIGRRLFYVAPSIGAAQFPRDGTDATTLLEHADAAMYRQKARRRLARDMNRRIDDPAGATVDVDAALRRAISDDRLVLLYQPKVELETGMVTGVEALLRWRHPDGGLMLPEEFLPLAEENGMMPTIAEWVLLEACAQGKRWLDHGVGAIRVGVNLSTSQILSGRLPDLIERVLRFTRLPPELLELEVSERAAQLADRSLATDIAHIRSTGVRCVVDDFGSGGSLDYLEHFEFDALELDRRHVRAVDATDAVKSTRGRVLTAALAVGRALGVETVVEGVETAAQLEFVRAAGGIVVQGYLLGSPCTSDEIEPLLTSSPVGTATAFVPEDRADAG